MASEESKSASGLVREFTTGDPSSYANVLEVITEHLSLAWTVNFEATNIAGSATLRCKAVADSATSLVLDTRDLSVTSVKVEGADAEFKFGETSEALGTPLTITLPSAQARDTVFNVVIEYSTSSTATALGWLTKEQTADKKQPYMFSQCQAIHARSIIPCQDTPYVKLTYSASVTVPAGLRALMSALRDGSTEDGDTVTYRFNQPVTMPTYLIALAVGLLESKKIGPRSHVWAEPSVVEAAAYEFAQTEQFIAAGEKLLTPYVWTQYDVLVMPPSFPYGGMENPCLTFVTPTLLAGDRSLADVICHEIAHSWTGNLVTTRNWEHFWLNEGCTMWVQRKIMETIHGEHFFDFDARIGLKALTDNIDVMGHDNPLTCLCPELEGVDPDDAFSTVPYEKGFNFLYYLQTVAGGAEAFNPWFKSYIETFAGKTVTTVLFKQFYLDYFSSKVDTSVINWNKWFFEPGLVEWEHEWDNTMANAATDLAAKWLAGGDECTSADEFNALTTGQRIVMLEHLQNVQAENRDDDGLTRNIELLGRMDKLYGLTSIKNAEVRFRWQVLCLRGGYNAIIPAVCAFVSQQGRMKFVRPLYREMSKNAAAKEVALKTFSEFQDTYHPVARKMLATDLGFRPAA